MDKLKLYNIPSGVPFVDVLARGILEQAGDAPDSLSQFRILLPTRRACRSLREAFLRLSDGRPLMLPLMHPIGDIDEDELNLKAAACAFEDIPPALSPLRRQIMLAELVAARGDFSGGADQAMALAGELGHLLDLVIIADLNFEKLKEIDDGGYADHWQETIKFLDIIAVNWPKILQAHGVIDAADRRNRLIHALADLWTQNPPSGPIIAAGSTGTVPATNRLLKVIAGLPNGSVLLPGLDTEIDQKSWEAVDACHPQGTLKNFLNDIDWQPQDVPHWPHAPKDIRPVRSGLLREIMRPAESTKLWGQIESKDVKSDLQNLKYYECETEEDEALLIALFLRETLETPDKTAALVTPDRALAQRVSLACRRWGIILDDSGGRSLNQTYRGSYFKLILTAIMRELKPASLLSVLKHGITSCGLSRIEFERLVQDIEKYALRDNVAYKKLKDIIEACPKLGSAHQALLESMDGAFEEMILLKDGEHSFSAFYNAHLKLCEALATSDDQSGEERLWQEEDGQEAARLFSELGELAHQFPAMRMSDYTQILDSLMEGRPVRPAYGTHPRLMILGHLEARLVQADRMILASLNEENWPPKVGHDPWMSRPMRAEFGLPSPEMRIGLSAHDFGQAFCAPDVILTRAKRADNAPTVPCRWLERLETVLEAAGINKHILSKEDYPALAENLKAIEGEPKPIKQPAPTPPVENRPQTLSVTQVETWMRDPYALYAQKILRLRKLDDLEESIDARLKGEVLHKAFEVFVETYKKTLPPAPLTHLQEIVYKELGTLADDPVFMSFWQPRLERLMHWFIDTEAKWREQASPSQLEEEGQYTMPESGFTIKGKADRIDRMKDGSAAIIDYKTGALPAQKDVKAGYAPQLPLQGFILNQGGFKTDGKVSHLAYWKASGGQEAGKVQDIKPSKNESLDDLIQQYTQNLQELVELFSNQETPYTSLPDPARAPKYQDYAHLARVQEWSAAEEESEDAA